MFKLRKMINESNMYVKLICDDPEEAKRNCNFYIKEIASLKTEINDYIDNEEKKFEKWSGRSIGNWLLEEKNFNLKFKKIYPMIISYYCLQRTSENLAKARRLAKNIEFVETRLNQFEYVIRRRV